MLAKYFRLDVSWALTEKMTFSSGFEIICGPEAWSDLESFGSPQERFKRSPQIHTTHWLTGAEPQ